MPFPESLEKAKQNLENLAIKSAEEYRAQLIEIYPQLKILIAERDAKRAEIKEKIKRKTATPEEKKWVSDIPYPIRVIDGTDEERESIVVIEGFINESSIAMRDDGNLYHIRSIFDTDPDDNSPLNGFDYLDSARKIFETIEQHSIPKEEEDWC